MWRPQSPPEHISRYEDSKPETLILQCDLEAYVAVLQLLPFCESQLCNGLSYLLRRECMVMQHSGVAAMMGLISQSSVVRLMSRSLRSLPNKVTLIHNSSALIKFQNPKSAPTVVTLNFVCECANFLLRPITECWIVEPLPDKAGSSRVGFGFT